MTAETATPPAPKRPRRSLRRRVLIGLGVAVLILLVLVALLWLNRRAAARQALVGWLESQGIEADVDLQRVELDGVTARIRIGDPADPDVVVERAEVDYAIGAPWSRTGLGVTPSRIRLVRPVLRASFQDGKLSLGSLDPLIERFTGRPPRPDSRGPLVLIEQGRARVTTDYGVVTALADARIDDGKLIKLAARLPRQSLTSGDIRANDLELALNVDTMGDRSRVRAVGAATGLQTASASGRDLRLSLNGDLPYPDMKRRRGDGQARLDLNGSAGRAAWTGGEAQDASARFRFDGRTVGWIETFFITGDAAGEVSAARFSAGDADGRALSARLSDGRLDLTRARDRLRWRIGGDARAQGADLSAPALHARAFQLASSRLVAGGEAARWEASGPLNLAAAELGSGDLTLKTVSAQARLDAVADAGFQLALDGGLRSQGGAWPLFGPVAGDDLPDLAEMKRALGGFSLSAPAFSVRAGGSGTRVTLGAPAVVRPANGGVLTVSPVSTPVFAARAGELGGGALRLTATRGRGLPEAAIAIPRWRLTPSGFTATLDARAALDFDLARGIDLTTRGELASSGGVLTYTAAGCAAVTLDRLELDENDVTDLTGRFCPADGPLVRIADGGWRAHGRLEAVDAAAPFLQLTIREAEGVLTATGGPRGVGLDVQVSRAGVVDAAEPRRFNALTATGAARLADENWSGGFDLARAGTRLGRLDLAHDGRTGQGGLMIDAPSLTFAEGGLQPADLSPLASAIGSPATGSAGFTGRIDWRAEGEGSSGGVLTVPGLDFVSPLGPVKGLTGTVAFSSLVPLVTAPDQSLTVASIDTFAPLTDVEITFDLDAEAVRVDAGTVALGGGRLTIEPFALPLDRTKPFDGVLVLDRVQLGDIVAASGFADKVKLDAVVSGRLPFTADPVAGVRIRSGSLAAVQPGRLSIDRTALTGVEAAGGAEGAPPNMVQDLAYQAMENLSFEVLSAEVNSLDEGRLAVLFHIVGRHDPPERQELRLTWLELIRRDFLNRELPLPSGTGIDLTLDTTLNANQLIGDLMAINRARAGQPDATPAPTTP